MIAVSFSKLDANEVGLNYSYNSKTIENKIYTSGTKFLGLGHGFIDFPTTQLQMELDGIEVRTDEGIQLSINVKVNYRMVLNSTDALLNLYLHFGDDKWYDPFRHIMYSAICDAASYRSAFEWYTYRDNITIDIRNEVAYRLKDHYSLVDTVLLSSVTFPDVYNAALSATEAARQEIATVTFQISQAQTEQQTKILAAQKQAQIVALTANATATSLYYDYLAQVTNLQVTTDAQVAALISLQNQLQFSQDQLVSYVWLDTLKKLSLPQVVQFDPPPNFIN